MFRIGLRDRWIAGSGLGLIVLLASHAAIAGELVLDPTSEQLRARLGGVQELRVVSNGRSLTLQRPVIGIDGISYHLVGDGWPKRRPALFTGSGYNEPAPSNPIAWSDIDRIERRVTRVNPAGVVLGAGLGLLAGWFLGPRVAWPVALVTNSVPAYWITTGVIMIGTPVLGAVAMGTSKEWESVPYVSTEPHR